MGDSVFYLDNVFVLFMECSPKRKKNLNNDNFFSGVLSMSNNVRIHLTRTNAVSAFSIFFKRGIVMLRKHQNRLLIAAGTLVLALPLSVLSASSEDGLWVDIDTATDDATVSRIRIVIGPCVWRPRRCARSSS